MVCPHPLGERQLKGPLIQSSPHARCLPWVSPADPHRAFAIISPTFQMMKSRFKEAENPEIPQLMWQSWKLTTPSGFGPLLLTTRLNCLQMSFKHESNEAHHQHPGVHHTPPSSPAR